MQNRTKDVITGEAKDVNINGLPKFSDNLTSQCYIDNDSNTVKEIDSINSFQSYSNHYQEFICGYGAATVNITTTFPINKLMFRQQLHGINVKSALHQLRREGLINLYRGIAPPLLQKSTSMALMFGMYDMYKKHINQITDFSPFFTSTLAAALAGTTEAILCPFERIQVILQDKFYHNMYRNTSHAFYELHTYGIKEYYRGLSAILFRNSLSNILFFQFRTELKKMLPHYDSPYGNFFADFISGGVLGALISTIFFPINLLKTKMQSQIGGHFFSMRKTFIIIFNSRDHSMNKMLRGIHINYLRSLISWGIINATYELMKKILYPPR